MFEPDYTPRTAPPQRIEKKPSGVKTGFVVIGFILASGLSYFAGTFQGSLASFLGENTTLEFASLQETYNELKNNYDGKLDAQALIDGAKKGMVDAVGDDYTVFMTSEEAAEFDKSLTGEIGGGVGVEVSMRSEQPTVVRVLRDNPAEKAGVQVGDIIAAVNDESTAGDSINDIVTKIRGEAGTTVRLTLYRDSKSVDISVTRQIVNNPSVYSSVSGDIGVMTITRFDNDTGRLAREVARDFVKKNVRGVVLDLRGNGGGYVDAAQAVASIWLDDKLVVIEKNGDRVVDEIFSSKDPILDGVKTVVLVNESSASASEIVAGALNDHGAATLVGETTFGKGSVQKLVNLSDGATLKVTVARWYTPKGLNISEKGIVPAKEVTRSSEDINAGRDPQLDAAKSSL